MTGPAATWPSTRPARRPSGSGTPPSRPPRSFEAAVIHDLETGGTVHTDRRQMWPAINVESGHASMRHRSARLDADRGADGLELAKCYARILARWKPGQTLSG